MRAWSLALVLVALLAKAAQADSSLLATAREADGTTALHWAIYHNDAELVRRLLKTGANPSQANDYGATPLSEAAVVGNVDVLKALLDAGATVDARNAGQTALMVVARTSNVEAARLLIKRGADVNATESWRGQTALMWAAAQSQPLMVRELLKHGARVNERSFVNDWQRQVTGEPRFQARPAGGFTPLLYAARQGCVECARLLLGAKADVNLADPQGITPLAMATNNFKFDVAALLLERGANPNRWDFWGRTPLYMAVDLNTLPHGGWPDLPSLDETTSLKLIELLLAAGAIPDVQLKLFPPYRHLSNDRGFDLMLTIGSTPLLRAAKAGDTPVVRMLLKAGAKPNLPNALGHTPVMAAAGLGSNIVDTRGRFKTQAEAIETLGLLLAAGGELNAGDARGQTPLHGAAYWGWNDVVQYLADKGADLQARDKDSKTPVDSALGRAGGHGRGGQTIMVFDSTAELLKSLAAKPAAGNTQSSALSTR
jgi:ankyrin repeat protein